jgi:hypothetical protein
LLLLLLLAPAAFVVAVLGGVPAGRAELRPTRQCHLLLCVLL